MKRLTVIILSFMLQVTHISGATDCTPPWMAQSNPFYSKILLKTLYRCPSTFGDQNKIYCCYDSDGDVECCNFQEYFAFRFFCLIPIILIVLIILSVVGTMCCFLCPFCTIYKRRQTRSCAPPPYRQTSTRFPQRPVDTIYSSTNDK
ncbi:uncharacterized protein LOC111033724 isoform X2 [Myzus persicae]|uniref:uncharacterized protein LOC111033724 isoform X2 n=1 Tax=Myzus persicae TaxID=13164 RepID=UPI000B93316C|nr:uncharacterized protein LOC111033724 isoform X2 [Myzus persicae]